MPQKNPLSKNTSQPGDLPRWFWITGIILLIISLMIYIAVGVQKIAEEPATETPTSSPFVRPQTEITPIPANSGKMSIWHALPETEAQALNEIVFLFQEQNPGLVVEVLFIPSADLLDKYQAAAAAGGGPDILLGLADWGPSLHEDGLLNDMSDFLENPAMPQFNSAALALSQFQGGQFGLPYRIGGVVMYRNTALVPEAPSTLDELVALAEAAIGQETYGALLEMNPFYSLGHLYALGGALMDPNGDPAFNTPEGVAWLEMLGTFRDLGADLWFGDFDLELFKDGNVGILVDTTWSLLDIAGALGAGNLTVDPWPEGMSGFVFSDCLYLNPNLSKDDADLIQTFAAYFFSPEAQAVFASADPGFIPAVSGVELDRLRLEAQTALEGGVPYILTPELDQYWTPLENAIIIYLETDTDADVVLSSAEEVILELLEEIRQAED